MKTRGLFRRIVGVMLIPAFAAVLCSCILTEEYAYEKRDEYRRSQIDHLMLSEGWAEDAACREAEILTMMEFDHYSRAQAESIYDATDVSESTEQPTEAPTFASYYADDSEWQGLPPADICGAYAVSGTYVWTDYEDVKFNSTTEFAPFEITIGNGGNGTITVKHGDERLSASDGTAPYDPLTGIAQYRTAADALITLSFAIENGRITLCSTAFAENDLGKGEWVFTGEKN